MNSLQVTPAESQPVPSAEVVELFNQNYSHLLSAALSSGKLLAVDGENVVHALAKRLYQYDGPAEQEPFLAWATEAVTIAADRMVTLYQWMRDYRKFVFAAIWAVVSKNRDLSAYRLLKHQVQEIAVDAWRNVFEAMDDLLIPGTAEMSSRLYGKAYWVAMSWRKSRLRQRERFADIDVDHAGAAIDTEINEDGSIQECHSYTFEPDDEDGDEDSDFGHRRSPERPARPLSDLLLSMKSGVPKLLCPVCHTMQAITPEAAPEGEVKLWCGHSRTRFLAKEFVEVGKQTGRGNKKVQVNSPKPLETAVA